MSDDNITTLKSPGGGSKILAMRRIPREPAMAELVTSQIRNAIMHGELAPGTRIRQEELADRLEVSRAPVRQALVALEREGLVQTDRVGGAVVAPLDISLIHDLYQFRGTIERDVAATLARRSDFDPSDVRDIVNAGNEAAVKNDASRLIELDLRFHTGLYDAVANRVLSKVMRGQWTHIRRVMAATLSITGYPHQVWQEHAAILDAIEAHDAALAQTRAAAHTEAAGRRLIQSFTRELPQTPAEETRPRRR